MENMGDSYIYMKNQPRARKLFIIIWMVLSWILSVSYMSVLLAKLVSLEYEKPIETVQDLLNSNKPIYTHPSVALILQNDVKERVRQLAKKVTPEKYNSKGQIKKDTMER